MKKTAIAILIAVLVVAIGAGLVFAGFSAVSFKFEKLDRTEYMTNTYTFTDPIQSIDMEGYTADLELIEAQDGVCKVVSSESDRERYTVSAQNGTLVIRPVTDVKKWSLFSFKSPKIRVYLPAGSYELLKVAVDTGDVTADRALAFGTAEIELGTGDLTLNGVQADKVIAHGGTGDIRLSDMTPETVSVTLSTGKIELVNVVCSGNLICESSTGDIRLTDVDGAYLYLKASTGDITGTVLTEKTFSANTSTGKVSVPNTAAVGLCKVQTSTGDIRLSVSGN